MYLEAGFEVSKEIATMMLACIMSDSLLWKSPTTTEEDKKIAKKLQEISEISDLEAFAMPMFHAKSDLGNMPIKDVIQYDYKIFDMNGRKCGIGSLETTNPSYAFGRKEEILTGLKELKIEQQLDFIMLSIIDILIEHNTTFILDEDSSTLEAIFGFQVKNNEADL
jgi:manganese-dependent inorganic pyrophosphatase